MLISFSTDGLLLLKRRYHISYKKLWMVYILPVGLPLVLGLVLGPLLGIFISRENLVFALPIVLGIPLVILLLKNPFAAIVIWLVVMPWFPFAGVYKYLYLSVHRLLIPLALGIVIISRMLKLKYYPPVRLGVPDVAIVAFGVFGIISTFLTGQHWDTILLFQAQYLIPFFAYWLIRLSAAQERELKRLIPLMIVICWGQYAISMVSWFVPQSLPTVWQSDLVGSRTMGTLTQPAIYGGIILLFSGMIFFDAMNRPKGTMRTVEILTFVFGFICMFFTFTRGVWLVTLVVWLGFLFLYPKVIGKILVVGLPIALILLMSVFVSATTHALNRLSTAEEDGDARLVLANAGKNMFYAKPVFGWGYNTYDRYDWKFMERVRDTSPTKWQVRQGTSHHSFFTLLAEMGVVGLLLLYLPAVWWLIFSVKALPRLPKTGFWSRKLLIVMWFPVIVYFFVAQNLDTRFFYYYLTLFWINLGFIANMVQGTLEQGQSTVGEKYTL